MDSVFDRALSEIGQDGKFQKKFDVLYNLILAVLWPMVYMNLILALVVVPHTCQLPEQPDGVDEHSWKKMNIPAGTLSFSALFKDVTSDLTVCWYYEQVNVSSANHKLCDAYSGPCRYTGQSATSMNSETLTSARHVLEGKRASGSPDGKRLPPPMDIRNIAGLANALPTFTEGRSLNYFSGKYTNAAGELKFDSCLMYTNFSVNNNTKGCENYEYDKTWYETTVPSENDWVCEKELNVANIFALSKMGEFVGSIIFGWFGDTYGRRLSYIISLLLIIVGRVISLLAGSSFILFLIGCIVAALPSWTALQSVNVISMELSSPRRRTLTATFRFAGWSVGIAIMSLLYWWLRDWKIFFIVTTAIQLPFLLFSWNMIESPRWLWLQGKNKKCVKYLKLIAKQNNKVLSIETEREILKVKPLKPNDSLGTLALFSGWTIAKNTMLQLTIWVCLTLSYSVVMMNSGEKTDGNPFLEIVWQCLGEIPGYFLAAYFADRIGRRYTGSISFSIMAATWMLLAIRESSSNHIVRHSWTGSTIIIINRLCATMSYSIINIFNMELYPTCIRQSGMALGNLCSSAGGALAPYVLYLGRRVDPRLTGLTLACTCTIAIMCNLLLPETLNKKLPETIEDAREFGKKIQKYIPVSTKTPPENVTAS